MSAARSRIPRADRARRDDAKCGPLAVGVDAWVRHRLPSPARPRWRRLRESQCVARSGAPLRGGRIGNGAVRLVIVAIEAADTWLELTDDPLVIDKIYQWTVRPSCGAVVLFSGTVRDHADGRPGVSSLAYEAYREQVEPRLQAIADEMRKQWPMVEAVAILHRVGELSLTDSSVVVCVSTPHRPEAFEAARFGIDALKATVPIWKREKWEGGEDWGLCATDLSQIDEMSARAESGSDR
jgi:molybdopterin synthase catalytic subunit